MSAKLCPVEMSREGCAPPNETAFGCPRNFLGNRFVYVVISPRAHGLSVGVNMNPDKFCNFDCVYCEVNRNIPPNERELDVCVMATELERVLFLVNSGEIRQLPGFRDLGPELLQLHHVAFSGDGEPTLSNKFTEAVEAVVHLRARKYHPFFKMVLITNGTGLHLSPVTAGLKYFTSDDEVWIKLDGGTQEYVDRVNRSEVSLNKILANAKLIGRKRRVIIQSLFPLINGEEPPADEIDRYVGRLRELKDGGANISLVQIYSATRPTPHSECGHLKLRSLNLICQRVRTDTGLRAEVF